MKKPKQGQRKRQKELEKANKRRFPKLHTINLRRGGLGLLLLFIVVFVLFAVSAPRTIALEDDGLFVSAAWFAGVVHPPGYPLYTILGWISSHLLPFGEIPWRVHIVSGFMGAVTCICIAYLVLRRTGNRPAAYLAGAALAVSEHFWSQAIIADVYTTNTALLFMALVMVQEAVAKRDIRFWFAAAFIYGLGLANHWPLLILGSPIFIAYAFASGKEFWGKLHYLILSALIPAILLYGWLVWRSHQDMPINFLGPLNSLDKIIDFISRKTFSGSSMSASFMDKVYYVRHFFTEALLQFSLLGGIVALWGMFRSYRNSWRYGFYGEVVTVLSSSLLLIWGIDADYEYLKIAMFRPFLLVVYCILALWFGLGINALIQVAGNWRKLPTPIIYVSFSIVIVGLGIYNGRTNYREDYQFAKQYAQVLFNSVESDAVFVLEGDVTSSITAYYHLVEGKYPHIRLLQYKGIFLNDRIVHASGNKRRRISTWREFIKNIKRPFYYQNIDINEETGSSLNGFINKMDKKIPREGLIIKTNDSAKSFFIKMLTLTSQDRWTVFHRNTIIKKYGYYLGYTIASRNPTLHDYIKDVLPLAENNYWSLKGMVTILLGQGTEHVSTAEKYLKKAKGLANDQRSKSDKALEFYLEGLIAKIKGNSRKARNLFRKSIKINRKKDNPAYNALKEN